MENDQKDQQQGKRQGQQVKQLDQGQETHASTMDPPLPPPPSTSPPKRLLQLPSSSSPPPSAPLETQSPPLDSPLHSNPCSNQFSLSPLSSPRENSTSLPLSPIHLSTINGSKARDGEVHIQAQEQGGQVGNSGVGSSSFRPPLRKGWWENIRRRALLWWRILGSLFCMISFSVLAADKNQGWALDSFYKYKEFRYCMAVNVMGFVYSGLQAYDLANTLTTGKRLVGSQFRYLMDFSLDQILAYLLLSASSSANFRVEDWESNWGKDKFPTMARASLALSYLAFLAFAACSLLSGYTLFAPKSR